MTHNATPKNPGQRPTRYPEHLAVMLDAEMKAAIVAAVASGRYPSQGECVRDWLDVGGRALDFID